MLPSKQTVKNVLYRVFNQQLKAFVYLFKMINKFKHAEQEIAHSFCLHTYS